MAYDVSPIKGFLCSKVRQKKIFSPSCPECGNGPFMRAIEDPPYCTDLCCRKARKRKLKQRYERKKKVHVPKQKPIKKTRAPEKHIPFLARRYGATFYTTEGWVKVRYEALKRSNKCCELCGAKSAKHSPLHVDHIKPRSKYPSLALDINNLQVLCDVCNTGKSNDDETDWRG